MAFLSINMANVKPVEPLTNNYPAGQYLFQIDKAPEERLTNDGTKKFLSFSNTIIEGPGKGNVEYQNRKYFARYFDNEFGRGCLAALMKAVGIWDAVCQNGGQTDPEWFVGRVYTANLVIKDGYTNTAPGSEAPQVSFGGNGQSVAPQPQQPMAQAPAPQPSLLQPVQPQMMAPPPQVQPQMVAPPPQAIPPQMQPGVIPAPPPPPRPLGQ